MSGPEIDIRVEIAPDAQPDGDPNDWSWLDVSGYRRQAADVEINYGRDDESAEVEAGDASCTFNLRDGLLSPRNPYSDLYERIGPNTPIRIRLPILVDDFTRTGSGSWGTATSGGTWNAPSSAWSVSGGQGKVALAAANTATESYLTDTGALDIDVTYSASISAVTTAQPWVSAFLVRRQDIDNQYRVHTEFKPSGVVTVKLVRREGGVNADLIEDLTTAATYSANTKVWTRIVADGGFLRAKVWSGVKADEPDAWNIWSTLVRIEAGGMGFYHWRLAGNTNVGTLTVSVDDLTVDALLWAGNVPEWPPSWDKSGNDSTMGVTAAGPMRQLNQGDDPVKSPLGSQLPRYNPAGYWTGEDGADAVSLGSAVAGGKAVEINGVTPGQDDAPAGSASAFKIDASASTVTGAITGNSTGSWSGLFFIKLAAIPVADTTVMAWRCKSGTFRQWVIRATSGGWQLKVYDANNDFILDGGPVSYADAPDEWTAVQLEVQQNGGNVDWALLWNRVGKDAFWAQTGSLAGTSQRLSEFYIPGSAGTTDALYAHIWAGTNDLPFVDGTFLAVSSGYAGELAADRVERLCAERGVQVSIHAGDSEPMGRQSSAKFLDLLRETAAADLGVLYERSGSLAYLPRGGRYNAPVAIQVDWTGGELAEAPKPTDDDQRLRNRWTVKRTGGSEATYENAESIAKRGAVGDSAEVNIETDERLPQHAAWRTALTTIDELRWPTIELDLVAHPELRYEFLSCRIGSRISVINPKAEIAGVTIDLIIEGIKQTIGRHRWDVTLTCSPAKPWQIGVWDDDSKGVYGAATTTVRIDAAAGATALSITSTDPLDRWSTTASGYQWDLAGETVTVQAMGGATGSGPYVQAVTVLRAQNGVSKLVKAGTKVKLKRLARWGL